MKKYLIISLVVILVVIGAGITYSKFGKSVAVEPSPVVCTKEVKICPDGSTVGRMSPNCEFEECPFTPDIVDETANWKTYKNTLYGFVIKYPANLVIWGWPKDLNKRGDPVLVKGEGDNRQIFITSDSVKYSRGTDYMAIRVQPDYGTANEYWDKFSKTNVGDPLVRLIERKTVNGIDFVFTENFNWDVSMQKKEWLPVAHFVIDGNLFTAEVSGYFDQESFVKILNTFHKD